jgi:hypothetical protein
MLVAKPCHDLQTVRRIDSQPRSIALTRITRSVVVDVGLVEFDAVAPGVVEENLIARADDAGRVAERNVEIGEVIHPLLQTVDLQGEVLSAVGWVNGTADEVDLVASGV